MRILLVEDDVDLAETLAEALSEERYIVDIVEDGETAWQQSQILNYDLILLDMMLPKLNGIGVCQRLRDRGSQVPILMLTACDTYWQKVNGLDAGADDYLVKPFNFPELFARIRALLRRGMSVAPPILEWENLCLNPSTHEVTYNTKFLHLTRKQYGLLELLLRNQRRVVTRDTIIENLWSLEDPPEEEAIKAHIKGLRRKLREAGAPAELIETVRSVGYRLKQSS
jgi:DNA-binding response OmpR family regulator